MKKRYTYKIPFSFVFLGLVVMLSCMTVPGYGFDYYKRYSLSLTRGMITPEYGDKQQTMGVLCKYGLRDRVQVRFSLESFEGNFKTEYAGATKIKGQGTNLGLGGEYLIAEIIYLRVSAVGQVNAKVLDLDDFTINGNSFLLDEDLVMELGLGANFEYRAFYHSSVNFDILYFRGPEYSIQMIGNETIGVLEFENKNLNMRLGISYFF